jgi:hypothetical protein
VNAAGVLQVPLAIFIWDDGYGISVPTKYQTTKGSVSEAMKGFQIREGTNGLDIYKVKGWDYAGMCELFEAGIQKVRFTHTPAIFHVEEVTQPQGHSTSGSHERYKSPERLEWERTWDGIRKLKDWIIENTLATEEELDEVESAAKDSVRQSKIRAWDKYEMPIRNQVHRTVELIADFKKSDPAHADELEELSRELANNREPNRRDVLRVLHQARLLSGSTQASQDAKQYYDALLEENKSLYSSFLYHEGGKNIFNVKETEAEYTDDAPAINGYEVLNSYFDELFSKNPLTIAFGEDVGQIGDVNQGFAGLQAKFGPNRIFDTGIREMTIMGQGIGLAMD